MCLLMLRTQRDMMDTVGTVALLYGRDTDQTPKARIITNSKQRSDEAISFTVFTRALLPLLRQHLAENPSINSEPQPGATREPVWVCVMVTSWSPTHKNHQTLIVKVQLVQRVLRF